jgi:hypothetical protein
MLSELKENEDYTTFQIADKVIRDHLKCIIPIVPMGKTYHEAYHEGKINFKQKDIHCDYQS